MIKNIFGKKWEEGGEYLKIVINYEVRGERIIYIVWDKVMSETTHVGYPLFFNF